MKKCQVGPHYLLADFCSLHNEPTVSPHPPKFNPSDKNGEQRRKEKGIE
ncbi:MAG: ribosome biogenesis protein [Candidatus Marsarchaeota archaeon]|nr:ribosome biogenesis protein [Candidatus Marsarchaeota archaeon]